MIKKVFFVSLFLLCSLFFNHSYAAPGQIINVSAALINDTPLLFNYFFITISYPGITNSINIDYSQAPSAGRYIASLPLSSSAIIEVDFLVPQTFEPVNLCQIKIEAISPYHAVMTQISQNSEENYICKFTGNPDDNSAKILIQKSEKNKK